MRGKRALREVVPHSRRAGIRRLYNRVTWRLYVGRRVACNCCGGRFWRFQSWTDASGESRQMCPRCGSLGRHRTDWLFLTKHPELLAGPKRLLHVAPEDCLERCLRRIPTISYLSADYDARTAMERMDITDIRYPDGSFDAIICNHVLEHVTDDMRALRELFRVLRHQGWALLQAPIDETRAKTFEDPSVTDPRERERIFGQYDHVRIYGRDYAERLSEVGFSVARDDFIRSVAQDVIDRYGLDQRESVYLVRKA